MGWIHLLIDVLLVAMYIHIVLVAKVGPWGFCGFEGLLSFINYLGVEFGLLVDIFLVSERLFLSFFLSYLLTGMFCCID